MSPAIAVAFSFLVGIGMTMPPIPLVSSPAPERPSLTAAEWILYDVTNDVVLAESDADTERPMASVTKVMTALVVREHADLDETVLISENAAATGESEIGVVPGETWTVYDLLAGVVIRSGNDAAVALAEHVGGSVSGFVAMMNEKATAMGLVHTHFTNPHGLDNPEHYTTARDLLEMAKAAENDPVLARLARTKLVRFARAPDGTPRRAQSTNKLLGVFPGVIGMKTGYTGKAGRVLISVAERNDRMLIGVVMGSDDHFADSRELLEWGFSGFGLRDRYRSFLLEEQGGGATAPQAASPLDPVEETILRAIPELPDGLWATSSLGATPLGDRVEELIRELLPVSLGGSG